MRRYALTVEYRGTDFAGWQVQPGQRTVQAELEAALATFLQQSVRVSVSGRTDAGVHALGQVVSFATDKERPLASIRQALNAMLPRDIAVVSVREVPLAFDPRRWSWEKHYRYRWLDRGARSPLRDDRVWVQRRRLDVGAMHRAGQALVGRHDFSSFRASGCAAAHPVREIASIDVSRRDDEVWLDVRGNGFLRHMVRIVAGTLTEVGKRAREPAWVAEVLTARDRAAGGRTAPPGGLSLIAVRYEEGPPPWHGGGPASEDD